MVLDSVHGIPPKSHGGDGRTMGATEIVRGHLGLDAKLGADLAHCRVQGGSPTTTGGGEDIADRAVADELGNDRARRGRNPHAMALSVLGAGPHLARLPRHFPPAVFDVLDAHARCFSRALTQ